MAFWDDFAEGLKDVGTSATRIVTDTAIDIGDVATGFQFSDEMNAAKKKMSDAGVLSAADAIEKNHYPFLKTMERDAQAKVDQLTGMFHTGNTIQAELQANVDLLTDMCADVALLSAESLEAEALLADARKIPDWERWSTILDLGAAELQPVAEVSADTKRWEQIGRDLATTGLVVGSADGLAALVALGSLSKGRKLTKVAKMAKTGVKGGAKATANVAKVMAKASKFMKIGKMAGRASGALAVVTVGIDIGMSVAELEIKKSSLEDTLAGLDRDLAEARRDLADLRAENDAVNRQITALLNSVRPPQSRQTWEAWVTTTQSELRAVTTRLVSIKGIIADAERKARQTQGQPLDLRVQYVAAVDPDISPEEARDIIVRVDTAAGKADPAGAAMAGVRRVAELGWQVDGGGTRSVRQDPELDQVGLTYGFEGGAEPPAWTVYATAPWTRTLRLRWSYGANHSPASLPGRILAFADTAAGRTFSTLFDGAPQPMGTPATGQAVLQVHEGRSFGIVVSVATAGGTGLREFCATYSRHPIENDWHVGVIDFKDESGTVLQWTNRAGVSWDLLPHLAGDRLLKTPGSPYQDAYPGSNEFLIRRDDGKVTGFEFINEVYAVDPASLRRPPAPATGGLNIGSVVLEFQI